MHLLKEKGALDFRAAVFGKDILNILNIYFKHFNSLKS